MRPTALVLRAPGTNRDGDVAFAVQQAGATPARALMHELVTNPKVLRDAQLLVVPGGFSYADALGAGRLLERRLAAERRTRRGLAFQGVDVGLAHPICRRTRKCRSSNSALVSTDKY